jgi:hypothetical protein
LDSALSQVSQYTTEELERAMDALNEAAQRRNLYSIGSTVSRRVAAAAATAVRNQNVVPYVIYLDS